MSDTTMQASRAETDRAWSRIDSLAEAVAEGPARMAAHEATCAERYAEIIRGQERVHALIRWVVGSVATLALIELGKASLPAIIKTIMTLH